MAKKLNLKKGDSAFVVGIRNHKEVVTVVSIGTKNIITSDDRKYNLTGYGDFGYELFESEAAYNEKVNSAKVKKELISKLQSGNFDSEFLSHILKSLDNYRI